MARLPGEPIPPFIVESVQSDPDAALGTEEWLTPASDGALSALEELRKNGVSEEKRQRMIAEVTHVSLPASALQQPPKAHPRC